ncbi:MAG TPA: hypothetical protein VH054_27255 [Polyangiaceae bacterium]|nr:hypothetical protein [Polyangiaceae bacterium]
MKRNRILVLSSLALIASGALVFACGGGDDDNDAGNKDSSTNDAKGDTTTPSDAKNDTTTPQDTGAPDTGSDAPSNDAGADVTDAAISDAGTGLTFMVARVGGSSDAGLDAALTSGSSAPVFLEERNISDGSLVRVLSLPTAVNGQNQPLTASITASSEVQVTTSVDGKLVVLAGFAAAPGIPSIASTSTDGGALRVIARVDNAGNIDTTTEVSAFDGVDIRAASTVDGGSFWAVGAGAADAGGGAGVQYVLIGSTGASTNIESTVPNTRTANIFGGQLYMGTSVTPNNGVNAVGTGAPTTSGQTVTLLNGIAGDSGSPYGFSMMDLDASVTGLDTLYIADDSSQANGGGIQKWVFDGTSWTKIATFKNGVTTGGFRGVMAIQSGTDVIVIGTTSTETNGNRIIKYVDDGTNTNPTGTVLVTAPPFTVYRGIAVAPAP